MFGTTMPLITALKQLAAGSDDIAQDKHTSATSDKRHKRNGQLEPLARQLSAEATRASSGLYRRWVPALLPVIELSIAIFLSF